MYLAYRMIKIVGFYNDIGLYVIQRQNSPGATWYDYSPKFKTKKQAQKWYDTDVK